MRHTALLSGLQGGVLTLMVFLGCAGGVVAQSRERIDYWRTKYQELKPADDPRVHKAQAIFQQLVQVAGKRPGVVPRLFIAASEPWDMALPIVLPDGWIILSKRVLDICYQDPTQGNDRLAFVLAHELAHQLKDDFWHIRFFQALEASHTRKAAAVEPMPPIVGHTVEQVLARELQADEYGILYAAMAGFNTQAIITGDRSAHFFVDWVRALDPRRLGGASTEPMRPTPEERAETLRVRLRQVVDQTAVFHIGLWFYYAGNYLRAMRAFEHFQSVFPSREVSHNLAVTHHQFALQAYQVWKKDVPPLPFQLSLTIDPLTRASRIMLEGPTRRADGTPALSPDAQFHEHLNTAITLYSEVLKQDEAYVSAAINLGCALLVRGAHTERPGLNADFYEAVTTLQRALEHTPNTPETPAILNTLGVALFYVGQPEQAKAQLVRAQTLAPTFSAPACNLASMTYGQAQTLTTQRDWPACTPPGIPPAPASSVGSQRPEQVMGLTIGRLENMVPSPWVAAVQSTLEMDKKRLTVTTYPTPVGAMTLAQDKEILMIMVREDATSASEKGIKIDSTAQDVLAAYGPPLRRLETTRGAIWSYDRLAFQFRDGQVISWLVF